MGGDRTAEDEDLDLTCCREVAQLVLLSIITDTHGGVLVSLICEHIGLHFLKWYCTVPYIYDMLTC